MGGAGMKRAWPDLVFAGVLVMMFAAAVFLSGCSLKKEPHKMKKPSSELFEFVKSEAGIQEYLLKANGLRVLLLEDHSAPVAAVMITYEAGSRNEGPGATGSAHMLEHMMFKGTKEYHKSLGTQIARLLENSGAEINATTSYDSTNYYEFLPNDKIPLALDIEAARMRGTLLDPQDFEREKTVIQNELERYFDSPMAALYNAVWQKAFKQHTYHHPVIGWREDVAAMPVKSLKHFYDVYYRPDHAVLTIVGSFETPKILEEIALRFSAVPRSTEKLPSEPAPEPDQNERRTVEVHKEEGAEYLLLAFKTPGALHPDAAAIDLISGVLTSGKTSRLYQKIVQSGLAASVESSASGTRDPGLFSVLVTLSSSNHDAVEKAVLDTLDEIQRDGISAEELSRVLNQIRSAVAFSRDGAFSVAGELAQAIGMGDWRLFTGYLTRAEQVQPEDIKRIAAEYFKAERLTSGRLFTGMASGPGTASENVRPGKTGMPGEHSSAEDDGVEPGDKTKMPTRVKELLESLDVSAYPTHYGDEVQTFTAGEAKLLTLKTSVKNIVAFSGSFARAGTAYSENPVLPKLTTQMIDKGTEGRAPLEIAELLESRGADVHYGVDAEYVRFQGRCLKADFPLVMKLMMEQLKKPSFDAEEFRKLKDREKVNLRYTMAATSSQAANALMRSVFSKGHPLRPASYDEQLSWLEKTNIEDLREFHRSHYGLQNLRLSVSGDLEAVEIQKLFSEVLSGWDSHPREASPVPEAVLPDSVQYESIRLPEKQNVDVLMGHAISMTRKSPDFLPASLANAVLGGDFTARLSNIVRDRYGLTYGIRSGLVGLSERLTGAWVVHMIVNAPMLRDGIQRTYEQMELFQSKGISSEELEEKKESTIGQFKTGLASTQSLADQILLAEELGLGAGYLDSFPGLVRAVTLDQANQAIRRYFHPEQFYLVAAGSPPAGQPDFDFPEKSK